MCAKNNKGPKSALQLVTVCRENAKKLVQN